MANHCTSDCSFHLLSTQSWWEVNFASLFCFLTSGLLGNAQGLEASHMVKNHLPTQKTQETWVGAPGWEDPLEEGAAIHSSLLAWRIQQTEEPGGLQSTASQRVGHDHSNLTLPVRYWKLFPSEFSKFAFASCTTQVQNLGVVLEGRFVYSIGVHLACLWLFSTSRSRKCALSPGPAIQTW